MDFTNQIILFGSSLFLISILASMLSTRLGVPLLLVFLILGMLAGEQGPGGIRFEDIQTAYLIGSLALAVILLDGGLRTQAATFRVGLRPALLLATLGVVLTAIVTGLLATWILNLHWLEGLLIGAIVGSTDAAAVFSLLHAHGLELKQRTSATLEIESGSNDPMAIFLTIAVIELLASGHTSLSWDMLVLFISQIGIGILAGLVGGLMLAWLINHLSLSPGLYPLLALSGGLVIFGAAAVLNGSGFLAIYLAGLLLGNRPLQAIQNIRRFHDGMAWLCQIAMFLMLGLLVIPSHLGAVALPALIIALGLILVARPIAVAVCLLPFKFPWREQVFIAWVGLRGAVPIILGLFPLLAGLENAGLYFNIAFFVVLVSLVLQGWTIAPAARLLKLEVPPSPSAVQRLELDLPGQFAYELVVYQLTADSPVLGKKPDRLSLPAATRVAGLIRNPGAMPIWEETSLEEGDYILLLTQPSHLPLLDQLFLAPIGPARLEAKRFFGEFVLSAEARLGDLAGLYGFTVPPNEFSTTLADYLTRTFNNRPVVGDRVEFGNMELVVREMEGRQITRVGLKLSH